MDQNNSEILAPNLDQFEELFHKNHQFLCMVAVKLVNDDYIAEDLVQEFFIKYWEGKDNIRLKTSFEAYAYRSVKNSCIDYLRRQTVTEKRNAGILTEYYEEPDDVEMPTEDRRLKRVIQLLNELPADRRRVFELHALERLSYQQIAEKLNISVNTVKTQLRRAYSTLRGKAIVAVVLGYLMKNL